MKKIAIVFLLAISVSFSVKAQSYTSKISKDSLAVLNSRIEILKSTIKVIDLKIKESEMEDEIEKLKIKLMDANAAAKASAIEANNSRGKSTDNTTTNVKAADKLAKKSKSDSDDARKALDKFNKQIDKVEDLRSQIQVEERKLSYKKPIVQFCY